MTSLNFNKSLAVVAALAFTAQANIVQTSYWQSHDFDDQPLKLRITDGIVSGTDDTTNQFLRQAWSSIGHSSDYLNKPNVKRASQALSVSEWSSIFPNASSGYSRDLFLKAVAKYPAFCGESNAPLGYSENQTCKREIAALLAHIEISSNGLTEVEDSANALDNFYPRGPLGLQGKKEYGAFSRSFFEGFDRTDELENNPERVSQDGYTGFAAAIWRWVTPLYSGPSPHSVMTGFYQPNASDLSAGHTAGFGTTILQMDKTACGSGQQTNGSTARQDAFAEIQTELGLTAETQNLTCESMWADFSWSGTGNKLLYFDRDWSSTQDRCKAVSWPTKYSAMVRDGYKHCVCDTVLSLSDPNCQQTQEFVDPTPGPSTDGSTDNPSDDTPDQTPEEPTDEPTDNTADDTTADDTTQDVTDEVADGTTDDDQSNDDDGAAGQDSSSDSSTNPILEILQMIQDIKNRPHYSEDEQSRTTWQIDELLDHMEYEIWDIEQAFMMHGFNVQ